MSNMFVYPVNAATTQSSRAVSNANAAPRKTDFLLLASPFTL